MCVSRLVERKGQDMLIRALPLIQRAGARRGRAARRRRADAGASWCGWPPSSAWRGDVVFAGAKPWAELPPYFAAGDVFCMPTRTRKAGFEVEGLGIVYLEASASGLPVVAGDSGGAPDAVLDGETGYVVDGTSPTQWRKLSGTCLLTGQLSARLGSAGCAWVATDWRWDVISRHHRALLDVH